MNANDDSQPVAPHSKVIRIGEIAQRLEMLSAVKCTCDPDHEESSASCVGCQAYSLLDEVIEHAEGQLEYVGYCAIQKTAQKKPAPERFQPLGRKPQPNAIWLVK